MKLSVVIPTWNEAETLPSTLASLPEGADVVVSDGGSTDGTRAIAAAAGARCLVGERGRARQMNLGARHARGDVLLFLHADGILGAGAGPAIERALDEPRTIGGSFRLVILSKRPSLRLVAKGSNFRARALRFPYGDQGLFLRTSVYEEIGGFPDVPFLEDVSLIRLLRRRGRLVQLDVPLATGDRHWRELGVVGTSLLDWTMVVLHLAGIPSETLAMHYRRLRPAQLD